LYEGGEERELKPVEAVVREGRERGAEGQEGTLAKGRDGRNQYN